ncbi:hypothetical protein NONI108955_43305 [Nocardia ninae]
MDERGDGLDEPVDVGRRGAEADAGAQGPVEVEAGEQRVRAEAAVADADAVFGGQIGGDVAGDETVQGEGDDADGIGGVGPDAQQVDAGDRGEAVAQPVGEVVFVGGEGFRIDLTERVTSGGERGGPEHVGRTTLVALRRLRPFGARSGDLADRATTGEVRLGVVEPVAAADEHARAERGVQLVAGEG